MMRVMWRRLFDAVCTAIGEVVVAPVFWVSSWVGPAMADCGGADTDDEAAA